MKETDRQTDRKQIIKQFRKTDRRKESHRRSERMNGFQGDLAKICQIESNTRNFSKLFKKQVSSKLLQLNNFEIYLFKQLGHITAYKTIKKKRTLKLK